MATSLSSRVASVFASSRRRRGARRATTAAAADVTKRRRALAPNNRSFLLPDTQTKQRDTMAKVLSCFNACAVGDGATATHSGASPAVSADELPIASLTELAPIYTLEGEEGCVSRCRRVACTDHAQRNHARDPVRK